MNAALRLPKQPLDNAEMRQLWRLGVANLVGVDFLRVGQPLSNRGCQDGGMKAEKAEVVGGMWIQNLGLASGVLGLEAECRRNKTESIRNESCPGVWEDGGVMNDETLMTSGVSIWLLARSDVPVAGESGVVAAALPPQSKFVAGWRSVWGFVAGWAIWRWAKSWGSMAMRLHEALLDQKGTSVRPPSVRPSAYVALRRDPFSPRLRRDKQASHTRAIFPKIHTLSHDFTSFHMNSHHFFKKFATEQRSHRGAWQPMPSRWWYLGTATTGLAGGPEAAGKNRCVPHGPSVYVALRRARPARPLRSAVHAGQPKINLYFCARMGKTSPAKGLATKGNALVTINMISKILVLLFLLAGSCVVSFAQTNSTPHDLSPGKMAPYEATGKLMSAVQYGGSAEDVKYLLDNGADVNAKDGDGTHVLQLAAKRGDLDIVKLVLAKGADVNATNRDGVTALHSAAHRGFEDIVKLLVQKGADVNAVDKFKFHALQDAAEKGFTNIATYLLDNGADINATNWAGYSILMMAVDAGQSDMVKLLLARGAKVNLEAAGINALDLAKEKGTAGIVQVLLQAGAAKSSGTKRDEDLADNLQKLKESVAAESNSWQKLEQALGASTTPPPAAQKIVNPAILSGTNTDSSGNVTNVALLDPFTLTNSAGLVVTDAVLVKLMPNKFIYKTPNGGGMLPLDALPENIRKMIGYDPAVAAQADAAELEKKRRQQEIWAQQKQQAALQSLSQDGSALRNPGATTVAASIRAFAQKKWPDEYDMQKYEIDKQTKAYNWVVSTSSAQGVPQDVFYQIKARAVEKWPDEYDMQKYEIEKQVTAYTQLQ